jgi:hypothetical protein
VSSTSGDPLVTAASAFQSDSALREPGPDILSSTADSAYFFGPDAVLNSVRAAVVKGASQRIPLEVRDGERCVPATKLLSLPVEQLVLREEYQNAVDDQSVRPLHAYHVNRIFNNSVEAAQFLGSASGTCSYRSCIAV